MSVAEMSSGTVGGDADEDAVIKTNAQFRRVIVQADVGKRAHGCAALVLVGSYLQCAAVHVGSLENM